MEISTAEIDQHQRTTRLSHRAAACIRVHKGLIVYGVVEPSYAVCGDLLILIVQPALNRVEPTYVVEIQDVIERAAVASVIKASNRVVASEIERVIDRIERERVGDGVTRDIDRVGAAASCDGVAAVRRGDRV